MNSMSGAQKDNPVRTKEAFSQVMALEFCVEKCLISQDAEMTGSWKAEAVFRAQSEAGRA